MKSHRFRFLPLLGAVLVVPSFALAQNPPAPTDMKMSPMASAADRSFADKVALAGMTEIDASRLALEKSKDESIRTFAQRMIDDHTRAADALKVAASKEGITIPSELDAKHQVAIDKLRALSDAQFDAAYTAQMIQDHKGAVALLKKEASSSRSAVQEFASSTLPTIESHLKMAEDLHPKS